MKEVKDTIVYEKVEHISNWWWLTAKDRWWIGRRSFEGVGWHSERNGFAGRMKGVRKVMK